MNSLSHSPSHLIKLYENEAAICFRIDDPQAELHTDYQEYKRHIAVSLNETVSRKNQQVREYGSKHPSIQFWIKKIVWKLPEHAKGYVQYTVRPYLQGYGCDGTTDVNIHLLGLLWAKQHNLDYITIYLKAYPRESEDVRWLKDLEHDPHIRKETMIPKVIDKQLLIDDLEQINNRSLAAVIEGITRC